MNRKAEIAMAAEEQAAFLADSRRIVPGTLDRRAKRIATRVRAERIESSDHSKLRGGH